MLLRIENWWLEASVGVYPKERERRQAICVHLAVEYDGAAASHSDALVDALDYDVLTTRVQEVVQARHYGLLEHMVAEIGQAVLAFSQARAVTVRVHKPGAHWQANVSVEDTYRR